MVTGLVGGEELREAGAGFRVLQHVWVRGLGLLRAHRASVTLPVCVPLCFFVAHRHCIFGCTIYMTPMNNPRHSLCVRHKIKLSAKYKAVFTLRNAAFI